MASFGSEDFWEEILLLNNGVQASKERILGTVDEILNDLESGKIDEAQAKTLIFSRFGELAANTIGFNAALKQQPSLKGVGARGSGGGGTPFRFAFQNYQHLVYPVALYAPAYGETKETGMVVLPIPPESFEVSSGNSPEEVVSVSGQTFSHAGAIQSPTITLEGLFPYAPSIDDIPTGLVPQDTFRKGFYQPDVLCSKFYSLMNSGQPFIFTVSVPNSRKQIITSKVVTITDFSWSIKAANGQDRNYSMTMKVWTPQQLVLQAAPKKPKKKGNQRPGVPNKPKVITASSRDSLWSLSEKHYPTSANKWKAIQKANPKTKTFRPGEYLPAGLEIKLP